MVGDCRRLLTDDIRKQLQGTYGLQPDGTALAVEVLGHLDERNRAVARELREWQAHIAVNEVGSDAQQRAAAFERMSRETAFTALNRLAALRMCEERGHVIECVRRGMGSDGFQLFERLTGGALGARGETYRIFLDCMCDELALDLGVLFDRRDPRSLIFPDEQCLDQVLALLTAPALSHVWQEDETIGWIYQYFNDPAERKKMRESGAPRNSYELAVRNQFFTPRYVVEFLTDNTLGRIWYEMTRGETRLKDKCRYLVRRPKEMFLKLGEPAPAGDVHATDGLSQEELLKQPVYIPDRTLKDPRTILMLDPACGSMHFGLYAFDLFEVIYAEWWDDFATKEHKAEVIADCKRAEGIPVQEIAGVEEQRTFFLRQVPRLIIEHNIHGIDIDSRCAQIAGLSLWLRAQKSWQGLGLRPTERPTIKRSNIVCAEPMPGERELLCEFVEREFPAAERSVFLRLLEAVVDKMHLAGEIGALLRIDEEIRSSVAEAKRLWEDAPKSEQTWLFPEAAPTAPQQLKLDLSGITDEQFWERAEDRIYTALRDYSEHADNGDGFQRRLFAEDAARGFAFIDICRKRYDVALMNPPFGECGLRTRDFVERGYADSKSDLFAAFFERGLEFVRWSGFVGALTSRLGLFVSSLEAWRHTCLLSERRLRLLADLGHNVLDNALVEAAAYVCGNARPGSLYWAAGLLDADDKEAALIAALQGGVGALHGNIESLSKIPGKPIAYWMPDEFLSRVLTHRAMATHEARTRVGLQTDDDFRFLRLTWECNATDLRRIWRFFAKGGEYSPFYDDFHLVVNWPAEAPEMRAFIEQRYSWTKNARSVGLYGQPGLTYPERTTSELSVRPMPEGTVFSVKGPAIFAASESARFALASLTYTRVFRIVLEIFIGSGDAVQSGSAARDYKAGILNRLPVPSLAGPYGDILAESGAGCIRAVMDQWARDETSRLFQGLPAHKSDCLVTHSADQLRHFEDHLMMLEGLTHAADRAASHLYGFDDQHESFMRTAYGVHPASLSRELSPGRTVDQMDWPINVLVDAVSKKCGYSRQTTKLAFWTDRRYEAIALLNGASVTQVVQARRASESVPKWLRKEDTERMVSYILGIAFGRWDIRFATGERPRPELPNPFAPLPICSPGQLQNAEGLPAGAEDVPSSYPVGFPRHGIFVDDPNHRLDIERCVREITAVIWKDGAPGIEQEACELLGLKTLRDYFRRPTGFFADHLKRYSKSRRQAPIYWPLSTASGSYTLWIYYHRLTDQTLYACVNDFVQPKLNDLERDILRLRDEKRTKDLEAAVALQGELEDVKQELLAWASRWKPNLNDGVLITACPLWRLFRLPKWRKDLETCWKNLEAGEYDWAHLAHSLWPERVREKCKKDRSLAIAHALEGICGVAPPKPKKARNGRGSKSDSGRQMDLGSGDDVEELDT